MDNGYLMEFLHTGIMAAQRFTIGSEVDGDLHDELKRLGLGHISGILDALGVMQWDDLGLLSDDELAEAGVRLVQRKRLRLAAGNAASGLRASEVAPGASEPLLLLPDLVPRCLAASLLLPPAAALSVSPPAVRLDAYGGTAEAEAGMAASSGEPVCAG